MPSAYRRRPWYRALPAPSKAEAIFLAAATLLLVVELVYFLLRHRS